MNGTSQGLYPIIRRARRPLIIQDDDSGPSPLPPPVPPVVREGDVNYSKASTPAGKGKSGKSSASERSG